MGVTINHSGKVRATSLLMRYPCNGDSYSGFDATYVICEPLIIRRHPVSWKRDRLGLPVSLICDGKATLVSHLRNVFAPMARIGHRKLQGW